MDRIQEINKEISAAKQELNQLEEKRSAILHRITTLKEKLRQESINGVESCLPVNTTVTNQSQSGDKIKLFMSLFKGRQDVFPKRFESKTGVSGYQPCCENEWINGICRKPKIKCSKCKHRKFIPVSESVIESHLKGCDIKKQSHNDYTIGVYPLLPDDSCWFLAVDFDKTTWEKDANAFCETCEAFDIPAAIERSRSGNGAHVWIFFSENVPANLARNLGTFLITKTMEQRPEIGFDSYDRLFPSQDTLPKGGFGNLIALPLQNKPRLAGNTVFLDKDLVPFEDQWAYLSSICRVSKERVIEIQNLSSDVTELLKTNRDLINEPEDEPWKNPTSRNSLPETIKGPFPSEIELKLGNQIYIKKEGLSPSLLNRLLRIASFQNPEFYKAQAMRLSTYNTPRIISCYEDFPKFIGIPRGCLDEVLQVLRGLGIRTRIADERFEGNPIDVSFDIALRQEQEEAVIAMSRYDMGILAASTAFGKTIVALYLIAFRRVNTLILVHRTQLLDQWIDKLASFLEISPDTIGKIGDGKFKPKGFIDVATIQSLSRKGEVNDIVGKYGYLIVDECHHVSARSYEIVVRRCKAKYVTGLTATVKRKDGHHPIVFMNCGPIRYQVSDRKQAKERPFSHKTIIRYTSAVLAPSTSEKPAIHEIYNSLMLCRQMTVGSLD